MSMSEGDMHIMFRKWEEVVDCLFEAEYWLWEWLNHDVKYALGKLRQWVYLAIKQKLFDDFDAGYICGLIDRLEHEKDENQIEHIVDEICYMVRYAIFRYAIKVYREWCTRRKQS